MTHAESTVAVIGMAARFPGAPDVATFWRNLRHGVESITFFEDDELLAAGVSPDLIGNPDYVRARGTIDEADCFDAALFGISPREAQLTDPQQRLFLECALAALEDGGYDPSRYRGAIAVLAGGGERAAVADGRLDDPVADYQRSIGSRPDFLATRVAYRLDLRGPAITVQTACSTSLVAVCLAYQAIVTGQCDLAIAGGVSLGDRVGYLHRAGMILSPDGHCRAFDDAAMGTVPGDGVGAVLLKRLDSAQADGDVIRAVIRGCAMNNDGAAKVGFTAPRAAGQAAAISRALAVASVHPDDVGYVEAHGTATPLGDAVELEGLTIAFGGDTPRTPHCALGSVKTNIGHLDAAAGIAGLIKTVLAIENGEIPASLHHRSPSQALDLSRSPFFVNTQLAPWPSDRRCAGVSSFGVGGTNAHVVLDAGPARESPRACDHARHQLLPVSAASPEALARRCSDLADRLAGDPRVDLADVAFTLAQGRRQMACRRTVVAATSYEARRRLEQRDAHADRVRGREAAFMFSGQGVRYVAGSFPLYEHEPRFRTTIDRCLASIREQGGPNLAALVMGEPGCEAGWRRTDLCQPALFVLQYALAQLLIERGVHPAAVMGHSVGEYAAACVAGVMSMEDAVRLVIVRGALMQAAPPGAMLAVHLAEKTCATS
jgi:phthiocerol/phenolphthiocerol synthesis type-I polyketide synthase E